MKDIGSLRYMRTVILSLLLFLLLCIFFLFFCNGNLGTATAADKTDALPSVNTDPLPTVVLDAGHGGYDSGTHSKDGQAEKDLNLIITKKIAAFLSLSDVDVVLTRTGDDPPMLVSDPKRKRGEILSRAKIAQESGADCFLSVHMNSYPQASCKGSQVFYTAKNPNNPALALTLQSAITSLVQPDNQRLAKETTQIFLLLQLDCPAVLLECGFLSNPDEAALLAKEDYQNRLAFSIAAAIIDYLF